MQQPNKMIGGKYIHYKGKSYEVYCTAKDQNEKTFVNIMAQTLMLADTLTAFLISELPSLKPT